MSLSTVLAKALFDNAAESPEELAFRKGDILMVLEQEQSGGPGWWLCSLHGRQGIAPANRLRLLHTAPPPGTDPRRTPSEDSVYLSPGPPLARGTTPTAVDAEGVYRSPSSQGEALYQSPAAVPVSRQGELRLVEGGRPRSRSSSGPRPEWDLGVVGRPRSPSLRGRGTDASTLYQTPTPPSPLMASQHHRLVAVSVSVFVSDRDAGSGAENQEDNTYLVPREPVAVAGHSDSSHLVSRVAVMSSEDVYQTPTGGADGAVPLVSGSPALTNGQLQVKPSQESPGMYQVPTPVGAGLLRTLQTNGSAPGSPSLAEQKVALKPPGGQGVSSTLPAARLTKLGPSPHRGSPLLVRQARVPASPNFGRKPPPPAPPVRGVTRKDLPQQTPAASTPQPTTPSTARGRDEGRLDGRTKEENLGQVAQSRKQEDVDPNDGEQVYDTPPSSRWQRPAQTLLCDDDSIYNTPRTLTQQADQESEVYDVPTITLNLSSDPLQQKTCIVNVFAELEVDEDVYSVPTLPGLPLAPGDVSSLPVEENHHSQVYSIPGPGKRSPMLDGSSGDVGDSSEPDCGIYDVPALTLDVLPSSSSSSSSTRRLSVSSNGSGDVQWRASLSNLVQSILNSASSMSSRDLATSLAEILSVWKASQFSDPTLSLQQAWARLSDLLPALSACGHASPPEALLSLVQRALEDTTILLQTLSRPRLPSQDSLSRRPLPALPSGDVKPPVSGGMGSRKGSWIQERPLPPTPQPTFPLPPAVPSVTVTVGCDNGEDDPGNEYAGIGLTPTPAPLPVGDSVGYVKLQGKPEPPPDVPVENGHTMCITETRLSPSPPLPVSLSLEDSELLSFYSSQSLAHLSCLADSIDLLFSSVQGNQPPRVFVSRGKSLIVTAHKLVFIGDTLSRLLSSPDLRTKVTTSGGRLCQALKTVVVATKGAAQNYPSVSATQEMVDRVAELSQHAAGFSGLLQRLAQIS